MAGELAPTLQTLTRNVSAAAHGSTRMARDFRTLGVAIEDSQGHLRGTDELIGDVFASLAEVQDPTERAALSMRLLGSNASRLGPLLDHGAEGVRAAREELELLGGVLSDDTVAASAALTTATGNLDEAMLGLRGRIALFLMPALTRIADGVTRTIAAFSDLADHSRIIQTALVVLGAIAARTAATMIGAWVVASLPILAVGAALGLLILVIEDIWVAMQGGQSVIGQVIDGMEEAAITMDGFFGEMLLGGEFVIDMLTSMVSVMARVAAGAANIAGAFAGVLGFEGAQETLNSAANDLDNFGSRDLGTEASPEVAEEVRRRRSEMGILSNLIPDSFERTFAERTLRGPGSETVNNNAVNISVDASNMSPAEAERMVSRAVTTALTRESENALDTVGGGL